MNGDKLPKKLSEDMEGIDNSENMVGSIHIGLLGLGGY